MFTARVMCTLRFSASHSQAFPEKEETRGKQTIRWVRFDIQRCSSTRYPLRTPYYVRFHVEYLQRGCSDKLPVSVHSLSCAMGICLRAVVTLIVNLEGKFVLARKRDPPSRTRTLTRTRTQSHACDQWLGYCAW